MTKKPMPAGSNRPVRVLYTATVTKKHIMQFHLPFLRMCKEAGWETAVAARNDYANPDDCAIPHCDAYYNIPFERSPLKAKNITAYRELKRVINEGNYDIIHCHTPVGALLTRLAARAARKRGTRVIYTAHGFHFFRGAPWRNWLLYYPVERILARQTDVLITINREDFRRAQTFGAKRVVYMPGVGIDLDKFSRPVSPEQRRRLREEMGVPEDAVLLLSVGELNENKNHALVIRALAGLENRNIHYCIAGEGGCREKLTALAQELKMADRVHLAGYRRDVQMLYRTADAFCFPSLREGLPVALMEAMASGLPCAASRIRGNTDLLDEESGRLFDPKRAEDCREKLERLMNDLAGGKKQDYTALLLPFSGEAVMTQMKEIYGINEQ